jgi:hypothetical protein
MGTQDRSVVPSDIIRQEHRVVQANIQAGRKNPAHDFARLFVPEGEIRSKPKSKDPGNEELGAPIAEITRKVLLGGSK